MNVFTFLIIKKGSTMNSECGFSKQSLAVRWMYVMMISGMFCCAVNSKDFPDNIGPIDLTNEMWQILPDDVKNVFVGPDDRIWYLLNHPAKKEDLPHVYKILKEQFSKDSPQLYGAYPALFETNGRVWFITHSQKVLIGYDGHEWIERVADDKNWFPGTCYNHGHTSATYTSDNIQLGKDIFFPDNRGIHWFNGTDWEYKQFTTESQSIILRSEPEEHLLFACIYNNRSLQEVWFWKNGIWSQMKISDSVKDVIPAFGGAWFIVNESELEFVNISDGSISTDRSYKFNHVSLLHCNPQNGRCYLQVQNDSNNNTDMGSGLLMLNGDKDPTFLPNLDIAKKWTSNWAEDSGPIFSSDGQKVWLPARDTEKCPPLLLNLKNGEIENYLPENKFHWIHSMRSDGMVFASTREPGQLYGYALGVYQPEGKDTRNLLEIMIYQMDSNFSGYCIDSAGRIWTKILNLGLIYFNNNEWTRVSDISPSEIIQMLLPGDHGRVIIKTSGKCYYWADEIVSPYNTIKELIADNYHDVSENFTSTPDSSRTYGTFVQGVLSDKAGYIWLLESRKLSVLINGTWHSCESPLLSAGSRNGEVEYINRCSQGRIYATDFLLLHDKGKSFYGYVENGKPVFITAPHSTNSKETKKAVRDVNDGLWIACNRGSAAATSDFISGQFALRINDKDQTQELVNNGWAFLSDKAGNVWLGDIRGGNSGQFNLWRDDKIINKVDVPTADEYTIDLFSDKKGSVYVQTVSGLYHLTSSSKSNYSDYQVDKRYDIPNLPGTILQMSYSELGFFVITTYPLVGPREYYINLIHKPTSK